MSSRKPGRFALAFILMTVLIDTIGFGIIIPVMPSLIVELTGEPISGAAGYGGTLLFTFAAAQFICAPILGNLSDRFGRRPVLLISLAALGADYIIMGFAPTLAWLFIGRLFAGVFGATFATANAYVTDVSTPDMRAKNFGMVGAAWGAGFILGPVIGGYLGEIGPRIPFFAAAALSFANVIFGLFVLPETLKDEDRRPFEWLRANPVGALSHFRTYPVILGLAGVMVLFQIGHDAHPSVFTYYTIYKFGWSESDIGQAMAFVGIATIFAQTVVIRWTIDKYGELTSAYLGLAFAAIGFFGVALAPSGWWVYAALIPGSLMGLAMAPLRSIMASRVPANAQGELQGAISSLMSLTLIASPLIMTQLFQAFTNGTFPVVLPGAPYFLAGILMLAAMLALTRYTRKIAT